MQEAAKKPHEISSNLRAMDKASAVAAHAAVSLENRTADKRVRNNETSYTTSLLLYCTAWLSRVYKGITGNNKLLY